MNDKKVGPLIEPIPAAILALYSLINGNLIMTTYYVGLVMVSGLI